MSDKQLSAHAIELPPQLVLECATGLTPWPEIASKFGFTPQQWEQLEAWPPFVTAVESKRSDLQRAGVPFRIKAGLAAEDLLEKVYKRAVGPDVSLLQQLEALKLTAKLADYEPKQNVSAGGTGSGFSIVINLPNGSSATPLPGSKPVIDITPVEKSPNAAPVLPVRPVVPVQPALPTYMVADQPQFIEVPE